MARRITAPEVVAFLARLDRLGRQKLMTDYLTPTPSRLLGGLLGDLLPTLHMSKKQQYEARQKGPAGGSGSGDLPTAVAQGQQQRWQQQQPDDVLESLLLRHGRRETPAKSLGIGRHFCYWPLGDAPSKLAPDGADAWHAPGGRFTERLWTGGRIVWWDLDLHVDLSLNGQRACAEERVEEVAESGGGGGGSRSGRLAEAEVVPGEGKEVGVGEEGGGAERVAEVPCGDRVRVVLGREYWKAPLLKTQHQTGEVMAEGKTSNPVAISEKRYLTFLTKDAYVSLLSRKMPQKKSLFPFLCFHYRLQLLTILNKFAPIVESTCPSPSHPRPTTFGPSPP
jgi:hypothetical protein